ncbi:MAG TPA: hypothetical protein VN133_14000 [Humibacter sp.]|nr:hypothetical protein [Humibacter sp.]
MFGRRRHAAPAAVAAIPAPQLTDEQIFELIHSRLAVVLGEHGQWSVSRRHDTDTDDIFHGVLAHSIAVSITDALHEARARIEAGETASTGAVYVPEHAAPPKPDSMATTDEPAAFTWDPAPITIWTDLKKPVTGEFARVDAKLVA